MLRHELPDGYALRLARGGRRRRALPRSSMPPRAPRALDALGRARARGRRRAARIRATRGQIADNDGMQSAIVTPDGRLVGMVGFHSIDWMNRKSSIGELARARRAGARHHDRGRPRPRRPRVRHVGAQSASSSRLRSRTRAAVRSRSGSASARRASCARSSASATACSTASSTRCSPPTGRAATRPCRRRGARRRRRSRARRRSPRPRSGSCARTTMPMTVAVAGSSATMSA